MVQFSMPCNKVGRAFVPYNFILVFFGLNTLFIMSAIFRHLICYQCPMSNVRLIDLYIHTYTHTHTNTHIYEHHIFLQTLLLNSLHDYVISDNKDIQTIAKFVTAFIAFIYAHLQTPYFSSDPPAKCFTWLCPIKHRLQQNSAHDY
jgi:hypothetical protein